MRDLWAKEAEGRECQITGTAGAGAGGTEEAGMAEPE